MAARHAVFPVLPAGRSGSGETADPGHADAAEDGLLHPADPDLPVLCDEGPGTEILRKGKGNGFAGGGAFFLVGHLLYDAAFLQEKRPSRRQVLLWLFLSALMFIPLNFLRFRLNTLLSFFGAWAYFLILISTVVFSHSFEKLVFAAAAIFAVSDRFMILNIVMNSSMPLKILALLVYYGSLPLYGTVLWKRNYTAERQEDAE
ncbi:MAG: hypothetical protein IKE21_04170 [Erysipelotrichaceae bacterium]|nr:hypothetical protein [Erysipelotrichaceae bacterium]